MDGNREPGDGGRRTGRRYNLKSRENLRQFRSDPVSADSPIVFDATRSADLVAIHAGNQVVTTAGGACISEVVEKFQAAAPELGDVVLELARRRGTPAHVRLAAAVRGLEIAGVVGQGKKPDSQVLAEEESARLLVAVSRVLALRRAADDAQTIESMPCAGSGRHGVSGG